MLLLCRLHRKYYVALIPYICTQTIEGLSRQLKEKEEEIESLKKSIQVSVMQACS